MSIEIGKIDSISAAIEVAKKMNAADMKELRSKLDAMIAAEDAKHSIEAARQRKMAAALSDPTAPVVQQALRTLNRLGLSPVEANDLNRLNAALDSHRWSTEERMRCKAMLHSVGII